MDAETYITLRRLQNRYADIVTRRAWPELAEIFRPDCRLDLDLADRTARHVGPDAIGHFIAESIARFSFFHFVPLNTVIEIDEPSGHAAARLYIHELRVEQETGRRSDAYGVYHDVFERKDTGQWWFARRHYGSFSRTAPETSREDQVVFPLPEWDLRELLTEAVRGAKRPGAAGDHSASGSPKDS